MDISSDGHRLEQWRNLSRLLLEKSDKIKPSRLNRIGDLLAVSTAWLQLFIKWNRILHFMKHIW